MILQFAMLFLNASVQLDQSSGLRGHNGAIERAILAISVYAFVAAREGMSFRFGSRIRRQRTVVPHYRSLFGRR